MQTFTPSPELANAILNHPAIRPTAEGGTYRIDATEYLHRPDTLARAFTGGMIVFRRWPDAWDAHAFILPSERGKPALRFGQLALEDLARHTGGSGTIHTGVPVVLPAARLYCRRLGLKPESRDLFNEYYTAEISQWVV